MIDLTPYAGRWVALVGEQVAGVGHTPAEAQRLARRNRPRERVTLCFVEAAGEDVLPLSSLLARLRPLLAEQEAPVYLVGGAVRDALLGRECHDLDFALAERAVKLAFTVADALGAPAYVLDKARGTARVVMPESEVTLDFARFRGPNLEADLRDRDFTINAMALPATAETTASIIDPCGGLADLRAGQIRLTHPGALESDPLRTLRAIRQAATFHFTLTPETAAAVMAAAPALERVSAERIRDEVLKLLHTAVPHHGLRQMRDLALLPVVLPEIAALEGAAQTAPHHEPVLAHTISTLRWLTAVETAVLTDEDLAAPALYAVRQAFGPYREGLADHLAREVEGGVDGRHLLRLGALFHDVGKAETQTVETNEAGEKRIRFLGHDTVGAQICGRRLRRLSLSNKGIDHVKRIVRAHMRPLLLVEAQGGRPSRRAVFRFFRHVQSAGLDVALLSLADHLATYAGPGDEGRWRALVDLTAALCSHYFERYTETVAPELVVNGRDLIDALHLQPGPEIGRLLRLIEEAQAAGQIETREEALDFARQNSN